MKNLFAQVRAAKLSHALALLLGVLAAVGFKVIIAPDHTVTVTVGKTPTPAVKAAAKTAAVRVANITPTLGCAPALGTGKLGSCAPHAAVAAAAGIARAASVTRSAGYTSVFVGSRPVGVDVSSYQGCSINWSAVRVRFAFFKATEGTGYTDRCLAHNVASAKAAKLPYGVYDFLRPGRSSATAEADHFVAAVRAAGANTSLPPVADVEANAGLSPSAVGRYVCAWHARVRALLHRATSITYTGAWFWGPQVAGGSCGSLLWVSAYTFAPIVPHAWARHTIWQYSDGVYGPIPHINRWDSDVFNGSLVQLHALAGAKPRPPRPVAVSLKVACRKLNWWRHTGRPGGHHVVLAVRRKRLLAAHHVTCGKVARR